ncbi:MAG: histidine phosphatase family protein [Thermomicrobiales bacterium]
MTSSPLRQPDLIVVRHASPLVQPEVPPNAWSLSPKGCWDAQALGVQLRPFGPLRIVTSPELKAMQTGEAILSGDAPATDEAFGEQGLGTVPFLPGDAFRNRVIAHFRYPNERVLGEESSVDAAMRFDRGVNRLLGNRIGGSIPVVVSHGRIVSAWLAACAAPEDSETVAAETIWTDLRMPDVILLHRASSGLTWRLLDAGGA